MNNKEREILSQFLAEAERHGVDVTGLLNDIGDDKLTVLFQQYSEISDEIVDMEEQLWDTAVSLWHDDFPRENILSVSISATFDKKFYFRKARAKLMRELKATDNVDGIDTLECIALGRE